MDFLLQVGKAITHAYSRATRSCPWIGDLWARYLLALERSSASEKEIYAVSLNLLKLKKQKKYSEGKDTYPNIDLCLLSSSYHIRCVML